MKFICDKCNKKIDSKKNEVYHASAIVKGKFQWHLHLCKKCYFDTFGKLHEL